MPKHVEDIFAETLELMPASGSKFTEDISSNFELEYETCVYASQFEGVGHRVDAFNGNGTAAISSEGLFAEIEQVE